MNNILNAYLETVDEYIPQLKKTIPVHIFKRKLFMPYIESIDFKGIGKDTYIRVLVDHWPQMPLHLTDQREVIYQAIIKHNPWLEWEKLAGLKHKVEINHEDNPKRV